MILINATDVVLNPDEAVRAIDELAWQARKTGQSWRTVAIVDALVQHVQAAADADIEQGNLQDKIAGLEETLEDSKIRIVQLEKDNESLSDSLDLARERIAELESEAANAVIELDLAKQ